MKRTAKKARDGTLTKAEMDRISKERAARGMKKGGSAKKGSGGTPACVKKHAKSSGKSVSTLNKVYKRGLGLTTVAALVTSPPAHGPAVESDPLQPERVVRVRQTLTF